MAGREYDQETKLYYMRARYYDPQLGRFLSEDPAGIAAGLNLYTYAGNDPINQRDPSGLFCISYYTPGTEFFVPGVGVIPGEPALG
jgi:RHS repeat-associated protein